MKKGNQRLKKERHKGYERRAANTVAQNECTLLVRSYQGMNSRQDLCLNFGNLLDHLRPNQLPSRQFV